ARVWGDPGELHQVVLNLIVNACDAMPQGGSLEISLQNLYVEHEILVEGGRLPPGPYVRLQVSDSGTGMPEEIRTRIFEPFFTTKEPGKGTGLGLSTVHAIVKRAHGGIAVESAPGQGTTFQIYFPWAREAGRGEPLPIEEEAGFAGAPAPAANDNGVRRT